MFSCAWAMNFMCQDKVLLSEKLKEKWLNWAFQWLYEELVKIITEYLELEETPKDHPVQLLALHRHPNSPTLCLFCSHNKKMLCENFVVLSDAAPRKRRMRRKCSGCFVRCCHVCEDSGCKFPAAFSCDARNKQWLQDSSREGTSAAPHRLTRWSPLMRVCSGAQCYWVNLLEESSLYCFPLMSQHSSKSLSSTSCLLVNNHLHAEHLATFNLCLT